MPSEKQIKKLKKKLCIYAHQCKNSFMMTRLRCKMFYDIKIEESKDEQDKYIKNFSRKISESLEKTEQNLK